MTSEAGNAGTIAPLPTWAYWLCVALCAGLPVMCVSGVVPLPWDAVLASVNAALAALIGVTRPAGSAERVALAASKRKTEPPPVA
jgi:hypothetical protein